MDDVSRFFSGSVPFNSLLSANMGQQSIVPHPVMHPHIPRHEHSIVFPPLIPQLVILNQKTHSEEVITKNGVQKPVFVVVKNSPFHIQLGVTNGQACKVDFNQIAFDSQLLYDCEGDKEVDFVKVKPLEFKSTPSENGQILDVELRIKVLTSQHEDMLFKVKILGSNPVTHEEIPGLSVISFAIKVISKPEQLKKKQPKQKRTLTDLLVETISRIEKKQEDQQRLIEKLITQPDGEASNPEKRLKTEGFDSIFPQPTSAPTTTTTTSTGERKIPDFEDAFLTLVRNYNSMKPEDKPEIIRKLIRGSSSRDTERLSELLDLFWTEGLQRELTGGRSFNRNLVAPSTSQDGCSCSECPHKTELERIDEFYKEFLSTGVSVTSEYS